MNTKRLLVVPLCILALTCSLFGQGTQETTQTAEKKEALTPISLWYGALMTEAGPPPADWAGYQIIRDKLGIELTLTALPSNENDQDVKIQAAGAANNLPDIFQVTRAPWLRMVKQGLIAPVDDMYAKMPVRTKQQYTDASIKFTTYNGHSYGLASPGSIVRNEGLVIRKDWLDKLGLAVPKTIDELLAVMHAFTYDDPDGNGANDTYGYGAFLELNNREEGLGRRLDPIFGAYGVAGTWNLTEKDFGLNVRKPAYYDAMSTVMKMVEDNVIDPNWLSYRKDDFRAAWKQGRFGIMREQNGALAMESNYKPFDTNFPNGEWIVIDPPAGPSGDSAVGVYSAAYRIFAVSEKAAKEGKKDAIARLLEWMSSNEGYYLLGWGVKGVNYTLDENGIPSDKNLPNPDLAYTKPLGRPVIQLANMVYIYSDAELKATFPNYKSANGKTMSALTVLREMQGKNWVDATGIDAMPLPSADLKRFYEQGVAEFVAGKNKLNPENWAAFIAKFDELGGKQWEADGLTYAKENGLLK